MALKNNEWDKWDWFTGEKVEPSIVQFANAERRLKNKRELITDLENEYDLLEEQAFKLYKQQINYNIFDALIEDAEKWFRMLNTGTDGDGNKLDKRRKYNEKYHYARLVEHLKEYLGIEDFEITDFIDYNFGEATFIYFTTHDHMWYLSVPNISKIRIKSYRYEHEQCFKLGIVHNDKKCSSYWNSVGSTFVEEELKDIMNKGIEEYCKDK